MPRKKPPPPAPSAVPAWFMTYSDVITLLMTFFILLLTFATSEPEKFEQMQIAMFGGGGAKGLAAKNAQHIDRDTFLVRYRPPSARLTTRGSETPLAEGPIKESLGAGLKSLEQDEQLAEVNQLQIDWKLPLLQEKGGSPSSFAIQQIKMLSIQLRNLPLTAELQVSEPPQVGFAATLATMMHDEFQVPPGSVAVSITSPSDVPAGVLRFVITRRSGKT